MASSTPNTDEVLAAAVGALGGQERSGQVEMAREVAAALANGRHLLVQAGTGTGKSLGYLVPSLLHERRVVVATATLALQHQLVERDIPALLEAARPLLPKPVAYAVLKGRSNYACLHRVREGVPEDDQDALVPAMPAQAKGLGAEVLALRGWAEEQAEQGGTGERDHAPRHTERAWRQVSVSHRECLGAANCPFGAECFVELAREQAQRAHLIITNHSLLSIDAIEGVPMIPDYDAVVIDEAHELTARVTQAATDELAVVDIERAVRRARRFVQNDQSRSGSSAGDPAEHLADASEALGDAIVSIGPGRLDPVPDQLADALVLVRDAARALVSAIGKPADGEGDADAARVAARGAVQELQTTAERMAEQAAADVLWITESGDRIPSRVCVAPLQVWGPMRDNLLRGRVVVFTSATLRLGGDFTTVAQSLGFKAGEQDLAPLPRGRRPAAAASDEDPPDTEADDAPPDVEPREYLRSHEVEQDLAVPWRAVDVGSPFAYDKQAILYIARHLPPPGRDGLGPAQLAEIVALVDASEGGVLGLFSSRRAAETAAEHVRKELPHLTTLAQGEAQLPELSRQFTQDRHASLFGTLTLWQGLDVPGDTCRLVLIDRVPFPRPDDPLMSARSRAADAAGGNGFMQVSATHAALLLAQGSGRLIRTSADRGVVAVLDPRLITARYGGFLRASLPPMWTTTDPAQALGALRRLASAGEQQSGHRGKQAQ